MDILSVFQKLTMGSGGHRQIILLLTKAATGEVELLPLWLAEKLSTKSTGIDVTGNITVSGTVDGRDVAADGALAASAVQPGDNVSGLVNDAGYLTSADGGDAATLDGIDSSSFLRSDAADDKTSGTLKFHDNVRAAFGTGSDLQIYHDANNSVIENTSGNTGDFYIQNTVNDKDVIIKTDNSVGGTDDYFRADGSTGEVILYHYGDEKIATKSTGIDVTGNITVSGTVDGRDVAADGALAASAVQPGDNVSTLVNDAGYLTAGSVDADTLDGIDSTSFLRSDAADTKTSGDLGFSDGVSAKFGTGGDLDIYHNGASSYITNAPGQYLQIGNSSGNSVVISKSSTKLLTIGDIVFQLLQGPGRWCCTTLSQRDQEVRHHCTWY